MRNKTPYLLGKTNRSSVFLVAYFSKAAEHFILAAVTSTWSTWSGHLKEGTQACSEQKEESKLLSNMHSSNLKVVTFLTMFLIIHYCKPFVSIAFLQNTLGLILLRTTKFPQIFLPRGHTFWSSTFGNEARIWERLSVNNLIINLS